MTKFRAFVMIYPDSYFVLLQIQKSCTCKWEIFNAFESVLLCYFRPVLLVQFLKSQKSGDVPADPAMIIVPAADQFSDYYKFSTTSSVTSTYTNYLLITIHGMCWYMWCTWCESEWSIISPC